MSAPVIVASVLVLAGLLLGLLPERRRRMAALPLMALAPGLVLWIAALHGLGIGVLWAAAVAALYRAPMIYWLRRLCGFDRRNGAGQAG